MDTDTLSRGVEPFVSTGSGAGCREVTVLVTGYGPWGENTSNPSHLITLLLPSSFTLPPRPSTRSSPGRPTLVRLVRPDFPLLVSHDPVAALTWPLLRSARPDLVLHTGLAAARAYYAPERSVSLPWAAGHQAGVENGPVQESDAGRRRTQDSWAQGLRLGLPRLPAAPSASPGSGTGSGSGSGGGLPPPAGWPERLETALQYDATVTRWRALCAERGVGPEWTRESDAVGDYLCGFISYLSHARGWYARHVGEGWGAAGVEDQPVLQGQGLPDGMEKETTAESHTPIGQTILPGTHKGAPALFLHVPTCPTEMDLARGKIITLALLQSMVEVWLDEESDSAV